MRKMIKLFRLVFLTIFTVFLISCTKNNDINNTSRKNISLILRTSYGYHWGTIKMGAYAAAREFNVDIDYTSPYDEDDVNEQINLVNQAIEKKVDALILGVSDYEALSESIERAYKQGIPVIVVDSEVDTEKVNSCILTNNYEAGKKAGDVLADIIGKEGKVGIINYDKEDRNAQLREEGLISAIKKYPEVKIAAKEYCFSDMKQAYNLAKKMLSENPDIDAIVALNEVASEGVAQAVDEMKLKGSVKVMAFNSTFQEIDYMDKGIIQATIVQNPFNMGYLSVKYALDSIEKKEIDKRIYIDSRVIYRDNMYLPENQKLLFPFIK